MKKFGLVFDCDGTLVDSLGAALDSFNHALHAIGEGPRTLAEIKRYFGAGADRIFTQLLQDEKKGLAAFEAYLEHQSALAPRLALHAGIRELLESAAAAAVPMGVVTGRHARDLEVILRPHKISDYFRVLIADSHVPKSKPAPDGILLAVSRLGLRPGQVFYVGDSLGDLQAAKAAGCRSIAALWDATANRAELRAGGPTFLAETPAEAWRFFCEAERS